MSHFVKCYCLLFVLHLVLLPVVKLPASHSFMRGNFSDLDLQYKSSKSDLSWRDAVLTFRATFVSAALIAELNK